MSVLIPRNTQIPVRREGKFITVYDNQETVTIDVYEGERPNIKHNNLLGEFSLHGLPPAPRGDVEIIKSMQINANGIVKVSAEHKRSGIKEAMTMTNESGRLSDDDIAKMIVEAEKLKIEDRMWKETVELRNALDQYIYDMNTRLNKEKLRGEIDKKDAENIQGGLEEAGEWLSENENANKDELVKKMENVKGLCRKIDKSPKGLATLSEILNHL
jgi:molecular chaperone DnaK (HSP70)